MLNRIYLLLGLAMFALIGAVTAHAAGEYVLATGDLVRVTVYDHVDLTTETRVNEQGSILFPLVGEVPVSGKTASEASSRIAKALEAGGFIRGPQVNLVVIDFKGQEVSVLGQVNRPGKFPLQKASRLAEVLALAGGVTVNGADSLILISNKDGKTVRQEIDLLALFKDGAQEFNVAISNDDILYVPREPRYYIYGEVQRPGAFRLEKNMSLVQALSVGGGLTARGTQKGIKILRRGQDGVMQEIEARLADLLKTDDVIFVKESLF